MTKRLTGELKFVCVSQKQLAEAFELSSARINQLIDEGIIIRDPTSTKGEVMLFDSMRNYYLSTKASKDDAGVNYWKERGLHEKAKREMAQLKLEKARGKLYDSEEVDAALAEMLIDFKTKLLGLGHKLAPRLSGKDRGQICAAIDEEIVERLKELSEDVESAEFEEEMDEEPETTRADDGQ